MNKLIGLFLVFFVFTELCSAADFGVYIGQNVEQNKFCYGLALDLGTIVPLLKIGFDYYRESGHPLKLFSLDLKLKSTLGALKPFLGLGIAAGWERFNLKLSEYEFFSFVTGGMFIRVIKIISLRLEGRFPLNTGKDFGRLTVGLFLTI